MCLIAFDTNTFTFAKSAHLFFVVDMLFEMKIITLMIQRKIRFRNFYQFGNISK